MTMTDAHARRTAKLELELRSPARMGVTPKVGGDMCLATYRV